MIRMIRLYLDVSFCNQFVRKFSLHSAVSTFRMFTDFLYFIVASLRFRYTASKYVAKKETMGNKPDSQTYLRIISIDILREDLPLELSPPQSLPALSSQRQTKGPSNLHRWRRKSSMGSRERRGSEHNQTDARQRVYADHGGRDSSLP